MVTESLRDLTDDTTAVYKGVRDLGGIASSAGKAEEVCCAERSGLLSLLRCEDIEDLCILDDRWLCPT